MVHREADVAIVANEILGEDLQCRGLARLDLAGASDIDDVSMTFGYEPGYGEVDRFGNGMKRVDGGPSFPRGATIDFMLRTMEW